MFDDRGENGEHDTSNEIDQWSGSVGVHDSQGIN